MLLSSSEELKEAVLMARKSGNERLVVHASFGGGGGGGRISRIIGKLVPLWTEQLSADERMFIMGAGAAMVALLAIGSASFSRR